MIGSRDPSPIDRYRGRIQDTCVSVTSSLHTTARSAYAFVGHVTLIKPVSGTLWVGRVTGWITARTEFRAPVLL